MFTVPCNSHSLQLLISDILTLLGIEEVWKLATNIVNKMVNSFKQYAYLRDEQEKVYKETRALVQARETR